MHAQGKKHENNKFESDVIKPSYINARAGTVLQVGITAMQCFNIVLKLLVLDDLWCLFPLFIMFFNFAILAIL